MPIYCDHMRRGSGFQIKYSSSLEIRTYFDLHQHSYLPYFNRCDLIALHVVGRIALDILNPNERLGAGEVVNDNQRWRCWSAPLDD